MNIAVVDDSRDDRRLLTADIERYARNNAIPLRVEEYESGEALLGCANLNALDAIFLDVFMDGLSGIETAYRAKAMNPACRLVFVTASPDFAVESYSVRAFYYILKPFTEKDIADVMNLLKTNLQRTARSIVVKEGREMTKILLSDILYVDQSNHYIQIHTEQAIISSYMKFQEIENLLLTSKEFLGCYRCMIINMDQIKKVEEFFFLLTNGEYVPINRKRAKEIRNQYTDYIFGTTEATKGR